MPSTDRQHAPHRPHAPPESHTDAELDRETTTATPRWITVAGIVIAIGVLVAIVVLHLSGAIGPGLHS